MLQELERLGVGLVSLTGALDLITPARAHLTGEVSETLNQLPVRHIVDELFAITLSFG